MVTVDEWRAHPVFGDEVPIGDTELLAHYTSIDRAAGIALMDKLTLSPLAQMNDPRESLASGPVLVYGSPASSSDRDIDRARAMIDAGRSGFRLACFTLDAGFGEPWSAAQQDKRCWARQRMWSQYGDGNRGVCLLFRKTKLVAAAQEVFGPAVKCDEVNYIAGFDDSSVMYVENGKVDWRRFADHSLFLKNTDWSAEREFRIRVAGWEGERCEIPVADSIAGMVLGPTFPEYKLALAEAVANRLNDLRSVAKLVLADGGVLVPYPAEKNKRLRSWTDQDTRLVNGIFDPYAE